MKKRAWVEIDTGKIIKNIQEIKKYTGKKFMACVKGNCYGMGMSEISNRIERYVDSFGVATYSEAMELRASGIKKPVLIMGPVLPDNIDTLVMNDISISLFDEVILKEIAKVVRRRDKDASVHIKIDTGLGRIGLMPEKTQDFIEKTASIKGIRIDGIFSHFATAGWKDKTYATEQIKQFTNTLKNIENFHIPLKHIANSPGILNIPESYKNFDMVRIGLLLFGVYTEQYLYKTLQLKSALKGFCRILYVKDVPADTFLGYGLTYKTKKKSRIATAGIGYADGFRRELSNNFHFLRKGQRLNLVGNICMDQTLVDVTGKDVKQGDIIQIFGDNFEIEDMAKTLKTIPQDILCGFGSTRMEKLYRAGAK
ncbi:MAG: alanine racemase [Elusimicrobia bacterium]|nr:alanine racemase [Elusimicrobiota bacterium]